MKLNLGCGFDKRGGWVNADKFAQCEPDLLCDFSKFPWPIETDACDEILLKHVLEHMGETVQEFKQVMQELYRIARPNAIIDIHVPCYRHESYWSDPTHVRAFTDLTFLMMSKKKNDEWIRNKANYTMIAYDWNINFELVKAIQLYDGAWIRLLNESIISKEKLQELSQTQWGVVREYQFQLKVIK